MAVFVALCPTSVNFFLNCILIIFILFFLALMAFGLVSAQNICTCKVPIESRKKGEGEPAQ